MASVEDMRAMQIQVESLQATIAAMQQLFPNGAASSSSTPSEPASRIRGDRVPPFSGAPGDDLNNWKHRITLIIRESGESRQDKIFTSVCQGLRDEAYTWFRAACNNGVFHDGSTWDNLSAALTLRFAVVGELQLAFVWLLNLAPGQAGSTVESISSFMIELQSKGTACAGHLSDQFLITALLRVLPPAIKSQLALQVTPNMTLAEATTKVSRLARTISLEELLGNPIPVGNRNVNNFALPPVPVLALAPAPAPAAFAGPVPMELAVMQASRPRKCNYCQGLGHWARDKAGVATCPVLITKEATAAAAAGH